MEYLPPVSPLDFNHIPRKDDLLVHFDARSDMYLVQVFFRGDTLQMIRQCADGEDFKIRVPASLFDGVRDNFLKKLIAANAEETPHAG